MVTKLGWGGIPIQRIGEAEAVAVVKAVIEMGIDLLDASRGYTTSEYRIGLALKQAKQEGRPFDQVLCQDRRDL